MSRNDAIAAAFAAQARHCDGYGSMLYGELCRRCADDAWGASGLSEHRVHPSQGATQHDALRPIWSSHAIALRNRAWARIRGEIKHVIHSQRQWLSSFHLAWWHQHQ